MTELNRKSIEPIALASGAAVRTMQEFLQFFKWDHARINAMVQHRVMDARAPGGAPGGALGSGAIGVLDPSGHAKRGDKTPGVQRQWCGETGKIDNCVVGQHLLYTDNNANNPFTCVLASDLYLPQSWADDRERCRAAGIGDDIVYRPKWRIAADQVREALGNAVRFAWLTFDEEFGSVPAFWFALDALGQRAIGEVKPNFYAWAKKPACHSLRSEHAARRVDNLCRQSPVFTGQKWREMTIKDSTRGPIKWAIKAARVHLVERDEEDNSQPKDRQYGLIIARKVSDDGEGEIKYFVCNGGAGDSLQEMLQAAFARWHIEKWFERAKQEAGFGAFEVRNHTSLIRHWLCSRLAMLFLSEQTHRLRGEKSADHVGAGGRGGGGGGVEDMATKLAILV